MSVADVGSELSSAVLTTAPFDASYESHTHAFLFARAQQYLQQRDYISSYFVADRLSVALRDLLRQTDEQIATLAGGSNNGEDGTGAAASTKAAFETQRSALTHSIEAVQHILALALYHQHGPHLRNGPSSTSALSASLSSAQPPSASAGKATANSVAGGASYAYRLLKDYHQFTEENQLFFAQCCFELQRYTEAEQTLFTYATANSASDLTLNGYSSDDVELCPDVIPPCGAQGMLLLGKCAARSGREKEAAIWLKRALIRDNTCWAAWQLLCQLGAAEQAVGSSVFQIDSNELLATCEGDLVAAAAAGNTASVAVPSASVPSHAQNPLLATPSTSLLRPLHMLSLTTPQFGARAAPTIPGSAAFVGANLFGTQATPFTTLHSSHHQSTAARSTHNQHPPSGAFVTPMTPTRGVGAAAAKSSAFASPPSSAKRAAGRHGRSQSSLVTPASASLATGGAPSSTLGSSRPSRKVASRLQWESSDKRSALPSSSAASSEYSSDDAGTGGPVSERERNERKLGRRVNRSLAQAQALSSTSAKTPRGPDASGPTTPRKAAVASSSSASASRDAPPSAKKGSSASSGFNSTTTPATRRGGASSSSGANTAAAGAAAPRKRLPEIAESNTPESNASNSAASSTASTPMAGTNLFNSLQTPLVNSSNLVTPSTVTTTGGGRHLRSRSQPAFALTGVNGSDDTAADAAVAAASILEDDDGGSAMDEEEDLTAGGTEEEFGAGTDQDAEENSAQMQQQAQQDILLAATNYLTLLLQTIAEGYRLQQRYQCKESIATFHTLPSHHYNSHLIFNTIGRCYFELHNYPSCIEFYRNSRTMSNAVQLTGLEYYSTALWHRNEAQALSQLAHACMEIDCMAAESWLVTGNCFSLQKESELSLKFIRRAIQLNPFHAYAYTLSAHEYMANEDFERALIGYRLSLGIDARMTTAWYGLGNLYLRQEKYSMAVYHFWRAIKINPNSSVLYSYLGMTYSAARKYEEALEAFQRASKFEPNSPLVKFQIANVYLSTNNYDQALKELRVLKEMVPRESNVEFLMGKICKKMGDLHGAMLHFVAALDLDPKDRSHIKAAIEHLHSGNMDDEEESDIC